MTKPWGNSEGYSDTTAYHGTKSIIREETEESKWLSAVVMLLLSTDRGDGQGKPAGMVQSENYNKATAG